MNEMSGAKMILVSVSRKECLDAVTRLRMAHTVQSIIKRCIVYFLKKWLVLRICLSCEKIIGFK